MSIMTQLEFELDFSHSEKEIAHYILNEGEKVLNLSITIITILKIINVKECILSFAVC